MVRSFLLRCHDHYHPAYVYTDITSYQGKVFALSCGEELFFIDVGGEITSGKRAFGLDPLVSAAIWAGTKGPAMSSQNRLAAREALVPARNEPLVLV
jgi:hypothetical protein